MARKPKAPLSQLDLLEARTSTAPCVPQIREAVAKWKEGGIKSGYKGVSNTTRILLNHWFYTDHKSRFKYHGFQQEAIETLIYLYEVEKLRSQKSLLQTFCAREDLRLLQYDDFARYCVKMATGSGKTKVMALAMLWHYFNAVAEASDDFASTFLLVAPNVIVYERLHSDFAGGRIFRADPMIPPELEIFWDLAVYTRDQGERASSRGALYLTNIQQLYERAPKDDGEPDAMTGVLGPKPTVAKSEVEETANRIAKRGARVLVLNDEAHHVHDEESEWSSVIRRLNAAAPLASQLDFSATPRHSKGTLFTWIVFDYPLKQAIIDNIVKLPIKGVASGIAEQPSDYASVRFQSYLVAGVERWKEYRAQLAPLKKKPILFVMLNDTKDADDVAASLRDKYPEEFSGDKLQVIHTKNTGEVSEKDLSAARDLVRDVDAEHSPINCIVSVLMLREGWDVQNVTVIVGLRPYSSKANILPEQTIGRGLRLMFRGSGQKNLAPAYKERVDVIGNKAFLEFIEQLEREEDLQLGTFEIGKDKLEIISIAPDPNKLDKDIAVPLLSPILARKKTLGEEIAALDVFAFNSPIFPRKQTDVEAQTFRYEGYDIITLQKEVEREYSIPTPQTAEEVIGFYARRIAQDVKLPSQFAALVPKVREFLEAKAFGERVDLSTPAMIKAISSNVAQYVTVKEFVKALREVVVEELEPQLLHAGRKLSETPAFPYSRPTLDASKCVFNLVPCDNDFEKKFARFLQDAPDVERFSKLPERFNFSVEYTDAAGNLRYYEPDFVAATIEGAHFLLETKGREDVDVKHKDRAAVLWCENATQLTGVEWRYLIVQQKEYSSLQPDEFSDLLMLGSASLF